MRSFEPAFDSERSEVNLTPMLDVVFIMLVFFVVTATFLNETGVPVYLPETAGEPPPDVETIAVRVVSSGIFVVNERVVSRSGLSSYLQYLFSGNPDANFAVLVSREARVEDTVTTIDAGRRLGFDAVPISPFD
jgi:biopolymer transport protein ExbD